MRWIGYGLAASALLILLPVVPVLGASAVAEDQKLGACSGGAGLEQGQVVPAIALAMLGQDQVRRQTDGQLIQVSQCILDISYIICANDPINDRMGVPPVLSDKLRGGVPGGMYGVVTGKEGGVTTGVLLRKLHGTVSEMISFVECGKLRDELILIARRGRLDWKVHDRHGRLRDGGRALADIDDMLRANAHQRRIAESEYVTIHAEIAKWANRLFG